MLPCVRASLVPYRIALIAGLLSAATSVLAQMPADPSGHWEGSMQAPDREIRFAVDLAKNQTGDFLGTISIEPEHLHGLPLQAVTVEGSSIKFHARTDQRFMGTLAGDRRAISGNFVIDTGQDTFTIPFTLTRTGDAQVEAPPRGAPIQKELEGTWNGAADVHGKQKRAVLTMANDPDGMSTGALVSVDEGRLRIPVVIKQTADGLTIDLITGGRFTGSLNAEGTELAGTYSERALSMPMTFRRAGQ